VQNTPAFRTTIAIGGAPTVSANPYVAGGFEQYYFPTHIARRSAASAYLKGALAIPVKSWVGPGTPGSQAVDPFITPHAPPAAGASLAQLQAELTTLNAQVAATKATVTQLLIKEWGNDSQHGCLGGYLPGDHYHDANVANHCDWTPRMMVQKYAGLFQDSRQKAMNSCLRDTGDDFTGVRAPSATTFHDYRLRKD
jgi:hypothetical protein